MCAFTAEHDASFPQDLETTFGPIDLSPAPLDATMFGVAEATSTRHFLHVFLIADITRPGRILLSSSVATGADSDAVLQDEGH
jgi:hypothetical protein